MTKTEIIKDWNVQNVADYALDCRYMVIKQIHNGGIQRWFYAADDDRNLANRIAEEITDREERIYGVVIDLEESF